MKNFLTTVTLQKNEFFDGGFLHQISIVQIYSFLSFLVHCYGLTHGLFQVWSENVSILHSLIDAHTN